MKDTIILKLAALMCWTVLVTSETTPWPTITKEINPKYWEDQAKIRFKATCNKFSNLKGLEKAKNAILFLGDGMGLPTIAASRFYLADQMGLSGSAVQHPFENWPFNTFAKTYDLETMVTDSASSANAYLTGSKTRTGMIGLTGNINYKQCGKWSEAYYTESVLKAAKLAGKSVGIVTTTRVTHASPAGCYGHVSYRNFENDADIKEVCPTEAAEMGCQDLACQLIRNNKDIDVIMGGGQQNFYPTTTALPADPAQHGLRQDSVDLVQEWIAYQQSKNRKFKYIGHPIDMQDLNPDTTDYVLALPYASHMDYASQMNAGDPTLMDYTRKAIEILQKNPKGYFLFVEGGRIDHAHHANLGRHALDEMLQFDKAIQLGMEMTSHNDTLLVVTADHSHSFELVGQPSRFRDVLDLENYYSLLLSDKMPMTGMLYMNGPNGIMASSGRTNPELDDTTLFNYRQQALVPFSGATHAGEDVGVYASGPFSHLFHRTLDNTFIAQSIKFALGTNPFSTATKPCANV